MANMTINKIYRFIVNNLTLEEEVNPMYFDKTIKELGFQSKDKFLEFNKKFLESLNETSIDFYMDLIKRIKNKKIELRNAQDPTYWSIAGWFYFNPNGKLVLLPGHEKNNKDVNEQDDFYVKLKLLCNKDQVRMSTDYFGAEWELSEYKYNYQTNRFMMVHPDS
jgi:hypothetical protein